MSKKPSNIEQLIASEEVKEITKSLAEIGIDELLDQPELIEKIPILSSVFAVGKTIRNVQSILLTKKLIMFLSEVEKIDLTTRIEMLEKLRKEKDFSELVGEHLMLLLEKSDSLSKPRMIGVAFRKFCEHKITSESLVAINQSTNTLPIQCFKYLEYFSIAYKREYVIESLNSSGEFYPRCLNIYDVQLIGKSGFGSYWTGMGMSVEVMPNQICLEFVKHILPSCNTQSVLYAKELNKINEK